MTTPPLGGVADVEHPAQTIVGQHAERNGNRMTSRTQAAGIIAVTLLASTATTHAGPCTMDIAQLENPVRNSTTNPLAGPTGRQTMGAHLGRQPTPDSVRQAEARADAGLESVLARAKILDTQGRGAECTRTLGEAKLLLDTH